MEQAVRAIRRHSILGLKLARENRREGECPTSLGTGWLLPGKDFLLQAVPTAGRST
jgi:hypothetical protein